MISDKVLDWILKQMLRLVLLVIGISVLLLSPIYAPIWFMITYKKDIKDFFCPEEYYFEEEEPKL